MNFGLSVAVQHPPHEPGSERIGALLEQVKLARDMGFDSISASQHYLAASFNTFSRFRDRFILGAPDDCIRQIRTHQEQ